MSKIIEITVSPKGETTLQTKGFSSDRCRIVSRPFETALGLRISEKPTNEFHTSTQNELPMRQ